MTEDQAKTKTCCGPRAAGFADIECIASACMAWRIQSVETKRLAHIDREGSVEVTHVNGYCGLAGQPT